MLLGNLKGVAIMENNRAARTAKAFQHSDDLAYGQIVLISARWILVVVGLILTLWDPAPIGTPRIQLPVISLMRGVNFYLHAQTLMRRQISAEITYAASAADLIVVTLFVLINGGFKSPLFTFYFPAVVAFAVVFPTGITVIYTAATALFYFLIGLGSLKTPMPTDTTADLEVLVMRVIILIAIAICGNLFLHIE